MKNQKTKLKTLKDLFHPLLKTEYFEPIKSEREFTKWLNEYRKNKERDIKAEAVKWVEAFEEDKLKERPKEKREVIELNNYSSDEVIHWIKHFFNLTEEDLK